MTFLNPVVIAATFVDLLLLSPLFFPLLTVSFVKDDLFLFQQGNADAPPPPTLKKTKRKGKKRRGGNQCKALTYHHD